MAVLNAGGDSVGPVLLQLQAYDGDAGGAPKGSPVFVSLVPGKWAQPPDFFRNSGVTNGWVKVTRMSGTAPWIAYAVINDAHLEGIPLTVNDVQHGSERFTRDLVCTHNQN